MRSWIVGAIGVLLAPLAGGCLDTSLPEGFITCETASDCPTGWSCRSSHTCWRGEALSEIDTDEDGVSDELERYAGTDPMDAGSVPRDAYIVVPYRSESLRVDLPLRARLAMADVVFLVDTRSSMRAAIGDLAGGFGPWIAPRLDELIAGRRLGLAQFSGLDDTSAAWFRAPLPRGTPHFLDQLGMLAPTGGDETHACAPEAIHRAVANSITDNIYGDAEFDVAATPILVLVSNSAFENGPSSGATNPRGAAWTTIEDTLRRRKPAILAVDPLASMATSRYASDFDAIASAVAPSPSRYAHTGSSETAATIARELGDLVQSLHQDVDLEVSGLPSGAPSDAIQAAIPWNGTLSSSASDVPAGASLPIRLTLTNGAWPPREAPYDVMFQLTLRDRGSDQVLDSRTVHIVVPATDGRISRE